MIGPAFRPENQYDAACQSAEARRLADSLSVLKLFLQRARAGAAQTERQAFTSALALIAGLEDLHRDLDRGNEELWTVNSTEVLEDLCARISVALLEPLGLRCEARIENGYMSAADLALLRRILPIVLTGATRCVYPSDRHPVVHVRARNANQGWCCAVLYPGTITHPPSEGLTEAAALAEAAGGRLDRFQSTFGEGVLIRLGQIDIDPGPARARFH